MSVNSKALHLERLTNGFCSSRTYNEKHNNDEGDGFQLNAALVHRVVERFRSDVETEAEVESPLAESASKRVPTNELKSMTVAAVDEECPDRFRNDKSKDRVGNERFVQREKWLTVQSSSSPPPPPPRDLWSALVLIAITSALAVRTVFYLPHAKIAKLLVITVLSVLDPQFNAEVQQYIHHTVSTTCNPQAIECILEISSQKHLPSYWTDACLKAAALLGTAVLFALLSSSSATVVSFAPSSSLTIPSFASSHTIATLACLGTPILLLACFRPLSDLIEWILVLFATLYFSIQCFQHCTLWSSFQQILYSEGGTSDSCKTTNTSRFGAAMFWLVSVPCLFLRILTAIWCLSLTISILGALFAWNVCFDEAWCMRDRGMDLSTDSTGGPTEDETFEQRRKLCLAIVSLFLEVVLWYIFLCVPFLWTDRTIEAVANFILIRNIRDAYNNDKSNSTNTTIKAMHRAFGSICRGSSFYSVWSCLFASPFTSWTMDITTILTSPLGYFYQIFNNIALIYLALDSSIGLEGAIQQVEDNVELLKQSYGASESIRRQCIGLRLRLSVTCGIVTMLHAMRSLTTSSPMLLVGCFLIGFLIQNVFFQHLVSPLLERTSLTIFFLISSYD